MTLDIAATTRTTRISQLRKQEYLSPTEKNVSIKHPFHLHFLYGHVFDRLCNKLFV